MRGKQPHLRKRAEEVLEKKLKSLNEPLKADVQRLVHELQVHQIELEIQNEDLRQAQIELEESRNKYADLYDFAPVGYFTLGEKGVIEEVNLTGAALLGVERINLLNRPFFPFVTKESYGDFYSYLKTLPEDVTTQSRTLKMSRKDGTTFYVQLKATAVFDADRNFKHFRIAMLNVTERERSVRAQRESEEQLRLALSCAEMGTWRLNMTADPDKYDTNLKRILGLGKLESTHPRGDFTEFVHPEDLAKVEREIDRAIQEGEFCQVEYRIIRPDGTVRWLQSQGKMVYDQNTKPIYLTGVTLDITERKLVEEQLRASLEEKKILLKEIHHRVKNNLQIISSLLNLQSRSLADTQVYEKFKQSQNRIKSMALIHEILYQSGNFTRINLREYVRTLANHLIRSHATGSDIKLNIDVDNVLLNIDKAIPCGLIINELISNSLKYGFPPEAMGGEIRITLRPHSEPSAIGDKSKGSDGNNLMLVVGNNGVPFPEDVDFRNTQSLGLQLVSNLVNQLNGTVELDRSGGTEFKITFSP